MKRRFINEDQLPFPEGRACGVVLDSLYTGGADVGMFKAQAAVRHRRASPAIWELLVQRRLDDAAPVQDPAHGPVGRPEGAVDAPRAPRRLLLRCGSPRRTSASRRSSAPTSASSGLRLTLDSAMLGVGGLMGIAVATSVPARRVHQLRDPRADHDPARRHRRAHAGQRRTWCRSRAPRSSTSGRCGGA